MVQGQVLTVHVAGGAVTLPYSFHKGHPPPRSRLVPGHEDAICPLPQSSFLLWELLPTVLPEGHSAGQCLSMVAFLHVDREYPLSVFGGDCLGDIPHRLPSCGHPWATREPVNILAFAVYTYAY